MCEGSERADQLPQVEVLRRMRMVGRNRGQQSLFMGGLAAKWGAGRIQARYGGPSATRAALIGDLLVLPAQWKIYFFGPGTNRDQPDDGKSLKVQGVFAYLAFIDG